MANKNRNEPDLHGGRLRVPRSRGAVSGTLLIILGAWGLLVPLAGPYVNFGYTPDTAWTITAGRFWLEVLPGAVIAVGGLLLLVAANRVVTSLGAWLAVAGGAWLVVGPTLRALLHIGSAGAPIHKTTLGSTLETLLLFTGLGALVLFLAAGVLGRLAVVSVRDVRAAQRRERDDERDNDHDTDTDTDTDTDQGNSAGAPAAVPAGAPATSGTNGSVSEPSDGAHAVTPIPGRRRNQRAS